MKKRKVIISVIAIALVLLLSVSVLVACGETTPETKTVTFKDGNTVVGEPVTVEVGAALTAKQIPAGPQKAGKTFKGWYVGGTKVTVGYVVNDNVVATAKYTQSSAPATTYTVTFKDVDDAVVGTPISVNAGTTLVADQIPAGPTAPNGQYFVGWFDEEDVEVAAGTDVNHDIIATAKYDDNPTVKFYVDSILVATVTVPYETALQIADVPEDPGQLAYQFNGWVNAADSDDVLDVEDLPVITANVVYNADMEKIAYIVTFAQDGEEDIVKTVLKTSAEIPVDFIPVDPDVADNYFSGWYNGSEKAEVGVEIADDVTFTAVFINAASFEGAWINTEEHFSVVIKDSKVTCTEDNLQNSTSFTFDASTGEMSNITNVSAGWGYYIFIEGNEMTFIHSYYDAMEEDTVANVYTLTKSDSDISGTYWKGDSTKLIIVDGVVTYFSSAVNYGRIYEEDSAYKIEFKTSPSSALIVVDVTIDEKGNFAIANADANTYNGLFVKAESAYRYDNYISDTGTYQLIKYTVGDDEYVWVYTDKDGVSAYATINGEMVEGTVLTFTADDKTYTIKVTEPSSTYGRFVFAGEEAGDYTGAKGAINLNGFGVATVNSVEKTYFIYDNMIIIDDYAITVEGEAYTVVPEVVGGISGVYNNANSTYYKAYFYNFGFVRLAYNGGSTNYDGMYTVSGSGNGMITVSGLNYYINGAYYVEEGGDVLVTFSGDKIYVKEGAQLENHEDDFDGWFKDASDNYVSINTATKTINYNDANYTYTPNYNGTKLTFKAKENCDAYPSNDRDYTVTIDDDTLTIAHQCCTGWDDTDEDYTYTTVTKTYTATEEPVIELDAFKGKYTNGSSNVLIINGNGTGTYNGTPITYNKTSESAFTFSTSSHDCTATVNATGLSIYFDDGYDEDCYTLSFTKLQADAFEGSWAQAGDYYAMIYTFDGYGTLTVSSTKYPGNSYYNGTTSYTVVGNVITIEGYDLCGCEWTFTLEDNGTITVYSMDEYQENSLTFGTIIKQ